MNRSTSRRRYLGAVCGLAAAGSAGCVQMLPGSDGDLVVRNRDTEQYTVTVIMDRGSAYTPKLESIRVQPSSEATVADLFVQSDHPYAFLLHVYLDGEYAKTTEHRWESEIQITIEQGGTVTADPPEPADVPVTITPQVRNETNRD